MKKILCIHQSAELYGSDRSFFSALQGLKKKAQLNVILPFTGDLAVLLAKENICVSYCNYGVLRKQDVKKVFSFFIGFLKGIAFYRNKYKNYDVIYINTVVMLSAIFAAMTFRNKKIYCHIREIPSKKVIHLFKIIFSISGIHLIYNSKATKQAFGLPGAIIYNGVDSINNNNNNNNNNNINLLLIGRINNWKGQSFFVDAIDRYIKKNHNVNFNVRIVGSAFTGYESLESDLNDKIEKYGLSEKIKLIPFSNSPEEHYIWSNYVVVPSTKPEPFGRVAIEAFSARKPVIAANHGGLIEIVDHKINGFLFEANNVDDLVKVLEKVATQNRDEYNQLCDHAYLKFEKCFSLDNYQHSIQEILTK